MPRVLFFVLALVLLGWSADAQTLNVKVGTFTITEGGAVNDNIVVTGVGFQPELILFTLSGRATAGSNAGEPHISFGAASSTTSRWAVGTSSAATGGALGDTSFCQRDDAMLCSMDPGGTLEGYLDIETIDSDGFTLNIEDTFPSGAGYLVNYIAFEGSLDVCLGRFTAAGTAPVTQAVTNGTVACLASFTPTVVLFASTREASDPPTSSIGAARLALGAMSGASNEATCYTTAADGADPTDTARYCWDTEVLSMGTAAAVTDRAEFTSFDANGFTINWLERGTTSRIFFVAIKGVSATVGDLLTQTDTTTDISTGNLGYTPKAVLVVSHGTAKSTQDTPQTVAVMSVGFGSIADQHVAAIEDDDNVGSTQTFRSTAATDLYQNIDNTEAIVGAMGVQTWASDSIAFRMSDADPSQSFFWYLALQGAAGGGVAPKRLMLTGVGSCQQ